MGYPAVKTTLELLRLMPARAAALIRQRRIELQEIAEAPDRGDFSAEYIAKLEQQVREKAEKGLAQLRAEAVKLYLTSAESASKHSRPNTAEYTTPMALAAQAAWQRLKSLLDAGVPLNDVISRAVAANDIIALDALAVELPTYQEAKALIEFGTHKHGQQIARAEVDAAVQAVEQAVLALPSSTAIDARQSAIRHKAELSKGWPNTLAALEWAEMEFNPQKSTGKESWGAIPAPVTVIADWAPGSTIAIEA